MTSQPKVLIVDDEVGTRYAIEGLLSRANYEFYFAENGFQALDLAAEVQPDIILLDVMMPGMSGFEVCEKIRATPSIADVPIVLITSLDDRNARMAGIKAGADDFMAKPFDSQELFLRVQNMTRLNRYMRQNLYNSIELKFYESFVSEQTGYNDQNATQLHAVNNIRDYVEAENAALVLFDLENPQLATKKVLSPGPVWMSEATFLVKNSRLCNSMPQQITVMDSNSGLLNDTDPVLSEGTANPIRNIIVAPLNANNVLLGAMIFFNPSFDFRKEDRRTRFLQLMVKSVSNATFVLEHTRQLTISKAALEASQWQILNSRNMLRTFFDNIPSYVYVIDRSYTIQIINNRRSERIKKTPQELTGTKCYEALYGNTTPCPLCRVADSFQGITAVRSLREWLPKETFVQWEITTIPIREETGVINRAIILDEDVTEKWILEASLAESEKLASIGQLAANVAHEINNPLAAIIANVQLLRRDLKHADEFTREAMDLIEAAGVRAAKIVGDLLKNARKERREEFEEISLNETIQDAISMVSFEIRNRNVELQLELSPDMPDIIAHQNQLKGVWINLLMNALGAMEDVDNRKLSISTRYENNEFRVTVTDSGVGIAPEHQERVFEPFFTTKETGKGTGLGLYVSLQVIKDHHGTIDFESKPGKGTKFIIILPHVHTIDE